ncbi:hypothetical protein FDECE_7581 [Fusarium decemcellulare]|nr:hypothetical protein FDECE_7581 [Fusarium decemcellulare]
MHSTSYMSVAFMALGLAAATPQPDLMKRSPEPTFENGKYIVDRGMQFANRKTWTFPGNKLPAGLAKSNYGDDIRTFIPSNVVVKNNYLQLIVPGGQTDMPYTCGEVYTTIDNIKYASVRTTAILSQAPGVCNGMFFYQSDTQEIDIEWLSDPNSESNDGTRQLWFTNQDANGDGEATFTSIKPPSKATSTEHEYRIDWTPGRVQFFVDGVKKWETTQDVPTYPGPWIWNNWSNGDDGWSAGPPAQTAVFKIKKIDMFYNTQ